MNASHVDARTPRRAQDRDLDPVRASVGPGLGEYEDTRLCCATQIDTSGVGAVDVDARPARIAPTDATQPIEEADELNLAIWPRRVV